MMIGVVLFGWSYAQKRMKPPKAPTNIKSVDEFVTSAFTIYNTVFDFHYGITPLETPNDMEGEDESDEVDLEVASDPEEAKKDEFQLMEESISQLLESVPDILEEIDNHSVAKQLKATLSVNRGIKALKESGKFVKLTFTGPQQ